MLLNVRISYSSLVRKGLRLVGAVKLCMLKSRNATILSRVSVGGSKILHFLHRSITGEGYQSELQPGWVWRRQQYACLFIIVLSYVGPSSKLSRSMQKAIQLPQNARNNQSIINIISMKNQVRHKPRPRTQMKVRQDKRKHKNLIKNMQIVSNPVS